MTTSPSSVSSSSISSPRAGLALSVSVTDLSGSSTTSTEGCLEDSVGEVEDSAGEVKDSAGEVLRAADFLLTIVCRRGYWSLRKGEVDK